MSNPLASTGDLIGVARKLIDLFDMEIKTTDEPRRDTDIHPGSLSQ